MASVRDIAEQAGVSIATVSRALNNDAGVSSSTRERVLSIANGVGYAATVGRRAASHIGFAYTGEQNFTHAFEAAVLEGVAKALGSSGHSMVLMNLKRSRMPGENFTQMFMRNGVRGVILRVTAESRDLCHEIAAERFPHVVLAERFESPDVCCIDCDSKPDSLRAVEHLIALGHRRIAFAVHNVPDRDHQDRFEGYREALALHDLPFEANWVYRQPATLSGGATAFKMIMSEPNRPTAIYFADWLPAVGAIKAAHELGVRVPDGISIVGFDDAHMRHTVHPPLTAVCQNAIQLGSEAALRLSQMLAGRRRAPFQITLPSFFEINESSGPPPARPERVNPNGHSAAYRPSAGDVARDTTDSAASDGAARRDP